MSITRRNADQKSLRREEKYVCEEKKFYGLFGYAILSLFIKKYKIITTMKKKILFGKILAKI